MLNIVKVFNIFSFHIKSFYYLCIVIFTKIAIFTNMEKKKEIKVTQEIRIDLMKEFPVCEKTVWNALKYETSGYTAEQIRRRALELGGTLMQEVNEEEDAEG